MTRIYEASVLSVEPRGDHQIATVRVQGLGTFAVDVRPSEVIQVGEIRQCIMEMTLGNLIGVEESSAAYR